MKSLVHGVDCRESYHGNREGLRHAAGDFRPYDVDGVAYCGKCHCAMNTPVRLITYTTFAYIRDLLAKEKEQQQNDYYRALLFLKSNEAVQEAQDSFRQHLRNIRQSEDEFQRVVRYVFKDHSDPEMRRFWGVVEENGSALE